MVLLLCSQMCLDPIEMQPRAHRPQGDCSEMAEIFCVLAQEKEQERAVETGERGQEEGELKVEKALGEGWWRKVLEEEMAGCLPCSVLNNIFQPPPLVTWKTNYISI